MEKDNGQKTDKKIDESWKESVNKEKASGIPETEPPRVPDASFGLFIYGLMMEAMIALGEVEHPVTKKKEANKTHAKFVIDTLGMLQAKTKGNLSKDETEMLEGILYDLRMRFLQSKSPDKPSGASSS